MPANRKTIIGVIGASMPTADGLRLAEQVGRLIAERGAVMVNGGLGGVMEAASKGAVDAGGEVLGILPGPDATTANPYVTIPVATNMGHARNVVIAHTADALIAVEGEFGTLSEMAIGLKLGKPVFTLPGGLQVYGARTAKNPETAVNMVFDSLGGAPTNA